MGFYYFAVCQLCKKPGTNLIPCNSCQVPYYCCDGHRTRDRRNHREFCSVASNVRNSVCFTPGNERLRGLDVVATKLRQAGQWQLKIGRKLTSAENQMWMFPKLCAVCLEGYPRIVCPFCFGVAYCKTEHQESDRENHAKSCKAMRFCLDVHLAVDAKKLIKWEDAKFNFSDEIQTLPETAEAFVKLMGVMNGLDVLYRDIEIAVATEYFTTPLNILYALEKSGFLTNRQGKKSDLAIHFVSAMPVKNINWLHFMEFMSHWIINLTSLQIFVVSPKNRIQERLGLKRVACGQCKQKGFSGSVSNVRGDYLGQIDILTEPTVVSILHVPFSQFSSGAVLKYMKYEEVPVIITQNSQSQMDKAIKHLPDDSIKFYVEPEENKYASMRPKRNFAADEDMDPVQYRNRFIAIVTKK